MGGRRRAAARREWPEGLSIRKVRPMTEKEMRDLDWHRGGDDSGAVAMELSDGTVMYPSQDPEGNGPGMIFWTKADGTTGGLCISRGGA